MAGRNPSRQPFHVTEVDLRSAVEGLVAGTAYDLGRGRSLPALLPYETRAEITRSTMGAPAMRLVGSQLGVPPLVTRDLKLSERSLAGAGSGFEQYPTESPGHREDAWREPRRVFKSVIGGCSCGQRAAQAAGHL
jgi:hypothetical protein